MVRRIRWSIHASEQLQETLKYWIKRNGNNKYAKHLYLESKKALTLASQLPSIGRPTEDPNIRRIVIAKKYGIYYSVNAEAIDINYGVL